MASPLTVWSSTADGQVFSYNADYATARSTAVTANDSSVYQSTGQIYVTGTRYCYELFNKFDTSSVGAGSTVTVATYSLYGYADLSTTDDFTIEARIRDWGATLELADWVAGDSLGDYTLVASHATSGGWSTSAYTALTSESAFLTSISKTGTTYVMANSSRHRTGDGPSGSEYVTAYSSDDATGGGTDRDPKLYVEYDEPATSPLTVWSSTADGYVYGEDASYAIARTTVLADSNSSAVFIVGQTTNFGCYEGFISFDTSSIGSGATVTLATLSVYVDVLGSGGGYFTYQARIKNWGATLTNADWVSGAADFSAYTLVASLDSSAMTAGAYRALTSESAFLTNVAKTGTTYIMATSSDHLAGNEPTGTEYVRAYSADDATGGGGTDRDPKLYVEWTEGGGGFIGMVVSREMRA